MKKILKNVILSSRRIPMRNEMAPPIQSILTRN